MGEQTTLEVGDRPTASITHYGGRLEPYEIEIRAECVYVPKGCGICGKPKGSKVHTPRKTATCQFKRRIGCEACGRPKSAAEHFGAPPSMNVFAGTDPNTYRSLIEQWKAVLLERLGEVLPPGVVFDGVMVEGEATFPKAAKRDQGNHRVMLEKALGDALQEGGWLVADTWDRYEFGGLTQQVDEGVSATRLMIFPRA